MTLIFYLINRVASANVVEGLKAKRNGILTMTTINQKLKVIGGFCVMGVMLV